MKTPVVISSKFQGKATFLDTLKGVFWEVLPDSTKFSEALQRGLIGQGSRLAQTRNEVNALCHKK
jgi:hypothetical protein